MNDLYSKSSRPYLAESSRVHGLCEGLEPVALIFTICLIGGIEIRVGQIILSRNGSNTIRGCPKSGEASLQVFQRWCSQSCAMTIVA